MTDDFEARAENLYPEIPYVRGWADASAATEELVVELRALGLEDAFAYLKADVNGFGQGFVRLERVTADAGRVLLQALLRGVCEEIAHVSEAVDPADGVSPTS
ncbi:hypothetical protein [Embleya sp. NPDC005575]|uniref:hypothetical protein n=1 Tax=Embleya sp. NPDC005575 TaxID=3156892 RepID=UPI0033AB198F